MVLEKCSNQGISIHSLVKRETAVGTVFKVLNCISIHSLVKRETIIADLQVFQQRNFNPLPRKEGDTFKVYLLVKFAISIHSLVKRETAID